MESRTTRVKARPTLSSDSFSFLDGKAAHLAHLRWDLLYTWPRGVKRSRQGTLPTDTMASLTINSMRRVSITSVLLILALVASSSSCVAGWGSLRTSSCPHSIGRNSCVGKNHDVAKTADSGCGRVLESSPGTCGIRGFVQAKLAAFHRIEISIPLCRVAGGIPTPSDFPVVISSIDSPETDRGPPRS